MALINNMYIFVESETVNNNYEIPEHKVEKGLPLSDHIERKAIEFSVTGKLLDSNSQTAYSQYSKLRNWAETGTIVKYVGRNIVNVVITSISKASDYKISNGASVTINFKEIRLGTSSYIKTNTSKQIIGKTTYTYHTVRKGETLSQIAFKYGVTEESLRETNKYAFTKDRYGFGYSLKAGTKLLIN